MELRAKGSVFRWDIFRSSFVELLGLFIVFGSDLVLGVCMICRLLQTYADFLGWVILGNSLWANKLAFSGGKKVCKNG